MRRTTSCAPRRGSHTAGSGSRRRSRRPEFVRYTITGFNVSNYNGTEEGSIVARLTYTDGSTDSHTFQLVKEDGWKICGDPY